MSLPSCKKSSGRKPSRRWPGRRAMATARRMATIFTARSACGKSTGACVFYASVWKIAEVVDPARQTSHERIYFGATVTYLNGHGEEKTVRIVGIDEARSEF